MKKALISPQELVETGVRIAQVENQEFDVATPLYWIDCDDSITAENHFYDESNKEIKEISNKQPHLKELDILTKLLEQLK